MKRSLLSLHFSPPQASQDDPGHVPDHPECGCASDSPAADEHELDDFRRHSRWLREAPEGTYPCLVHKVVFLSAVRTPPPCCCHVPLSPIHAISGTPHASSSRG